MKMLLWVTLAAALLRGTAVAAEAPRWVLAIHGGAGGIPRELPPAEIERIRAALKQALQAGGISAKAIEKEIPFLGTLLKKKEDVDLVEKSGKKVQMVPSWAQFTHSLG